MSFPLLGRNRIRWGVIKRFSGEGRGTRKPNPTTPSGYVTCQQWFARLKRQCELFRWKCSAFQNKYLPSKTRTATTTTIKSSLLEKWESKLQSFKSAHSVLFRASTSIVITGRVITINIMLSYRSCWKEKYFSEGRRSFKLRANNDEPLLHLEAAITFASSVISKHQINVGTQPPDNKP